MFTISSLLILFILTFKFLSSYIKTIRTGDPNETNLTYWMFSYDFKSQKIKSGYLKIKNYYRGKGIEIF